MEKGKKKIFGYDTAYVEEVTTEYCARETEHTSNSPRSADSFWVSVHSGCQKLVEERKDLLSLV